MLITLAQRHNPDDDFGWRVQGHWWIDRSRGCAGKNNEKVAPVGGHLELETGIQASVDKSIRTRITKTFLDLVVGVVFGRRVGRCCMYEYFYVFEI